MAFISLLRFSQIPNSRPAILNAKQPYRAASSFSSPFLAFPIKPLPVPECGGSSRKKFSTVAARMSSSPTPATDRLASAAAYALPFFNALPYGRFLLSQYPSLRFLFEPLIPLLSLYHSIPFASFVAFFGLYLGVVRNPIFSDYVRFNAMQAVTLDVLLALPVLFAKIFNPGRSGLGLKFTVWGHHAVFVFGCFCFVYAFLSCVLGKTPYLPFIADAAGRQV
uniref:Protein TIC 20 n=1 Tax=Rhizophora mucronata TaxID=61149 RepID=A0A2P2PLQ6_RHIMU